MVCKYSSRVWAILIGMIITGAARSIVVKLAYQSGFRAPLTITLLYLLGQSLSLVVYAVQQWFERRWSHEKNNNTSDNDSKATEQLEEDDAQSYKNSSLDPRAVELDAYFAAVEDDDRNEIQEDKYYADIVPFPANVVNHPNVDSIVELLCVDGYEEHGGSVHGLNSESGERTKWVTRVPYLAKPAIPSFFNLLNSALRWGALVYIDASVAEMMISGLELTLSVVAARIFRHRLVSKSRWVGVIIVTMGVLIVEQADMEEAEESGGARDTSIGVILILLQSILSVMQDTAEEIFMQADDFSATLMLGLEGLYGFCIGLVIYMTFGDQFGIEDIDSTKLALHENSKLRWWLIGLPFLFLITGIFNIKATEVTSAMTRNVWKNFRTILVWAIALGVYYLGGNEEYGEQWHIPESFYILLGFFIMFIGVVVYYSHKEQEQQ